MSKVFESLELESTGMVTMPEDKEGQKNQEKDQNTSNTIDEQEEQIVQIGQEQEDSSDEFENDGVINDQNENQDDNQSEDVEESEIEDYDTDPGLEVIYGQMKNFDLIDDLAEGEKLTEDYLREQLPKIEEKAFLKSIQNLSPDTKELLQFAFNNQGEDTPEKLREFFDKYVEPANFSYESDPKSFLKNILKDAPLMSEKDIEEKLEDWEEEGVLEQKAKAAFDAQKAELDEKKQEEIARSEENRQKKIQRLQEFSRNVESVVQEQKWGKEKEERFIQTIQKSQEYNEAISSNPKAYVQMMNFLSYFDPKKGEFDLDNWIAAASSTKEANDKTKKFKQDLLSSAISRASKSKSKKPGSKSADPLEVIITPEYRDLLK